MFYKHVPLKLILTNFSTKKSITLNIKFLAILIIQVSPVISRVSLMINVLPIENHGITYLQNNLLKSDDEFLCHRKYVYDTFSLLYIHIDMCQCSLKYILLLVKIKMYAAKTKYFQNYRRLHVVKKNYYNIN